MGLGNNEFISEHCGMFIKTNMLLLKLGTFWILIGYNQGMILVSRGDSGFDRWFFASILHDGLHARKLGPTYKAVL